MPIKSGGHSPVPHSCDEAGTPVKWEVVSRTVRGLRAVFAHTVPDPGPTEWCPQEETTHLPKGKGRIVPSRWQAGPRVPKPQ